MAGAMLLVGVGVTQVFPWVCQPMRLSLGLRQRPEGASPHPAPASTKRWRWPEESIVTLPQQAGRRESLSGSAQEELLPVGGCRDSWSGWPKQESGPFLDVHRNGLVVIPAPEHRMGEAFDRMFLPESQERESLADELCPGLAADSRKADLWAAAFMSPLSMPSAPRGWKAQSTVGGTSSQIAMLGSSFPFYNQWTSSDDNWRGRQSLFAPDPPLYLMCLQSL